MKGSNNFFLRNPDFLLIWIGQILSQSGGRMYQIAMIWWILGIGVSGTGKYVGFFMVMAALPSIVFVKIIGRTIDRQSSKKILVISDMLAFITVGIIAFLAFQSFIALPVVFAAGFVAALLQAFIDPTLNKAVQEVVPKEDTEGAVSLLTSTQSLANFAGAVLGAMLIDRLGIAGTVWLASVGYLISSVCSALARFRFRLKPLGIGDDGGGASGWAVLASHPILKKILIGFGLINFFATPILVVLPVYVKKTLLASATTLGTLEASIWLGILLGALSAKWIRFIKSRIYLGSICLFVFGAGLSVPGIITSVPVYMLALWISGFALGVNNVKFISLFQEVVDPQIKGRFFALVQALVGFTFPIAYFAFGVLTDYVAPPRVCLIQGMGVLGLGLYFLSLSRYEDELDRNEQETLVNPAGS